MNLTKRNILLLILGAVAFLVVLKFALGEADGEKENLQNKTAITGNTAQESGNQESSDIVSVGSVMPEFSFEGAEGTVTNQQFRGKPYVIEFISTTCPYCQASAPSFQKVFSESEIPLVVVSATDEELASMIDWEREYLKNTGAFVATNPGEILSRLAIQGTPTTAFIDKDGKISYIFPGSISEDELRSQLDRIAP